MDKKEAAQILGLRETALSKAKVKEAHRRMMIANHPDRGGAPYLASSKLSTTVLKCVLPVQMLMLYSPISSCSPYVILRSTEINEAKDLLDKVVTR